MTGDTAREGTVLRAQSGHCRILDDTGRTWHALLRGRLKSGPRLARTVVAAGDRVRFRPVDAAAGEAVLEEVLPRRNRISRRTTRRDRGRREHVLMANLDRVIVVQSVARPAPVPGFVDRLLAAAEQHAVPAAVCVHKSDLDPDAAADPAWDWYAGLGYRVLRTSTVTGEGVDAFRELLAGSTSIVLGASGTGKSSLIAAATGLELRVGEVTARTGLGRHTTTHTELYPVPGGGFIADSPGLRGFDLWGVEPREIQALMPDIAREAAGCRFHSCLHVAEPDCAVRAAVDAGRLPAWRYRAYRRLLAEAEEHRRP